MSRYIAELKEEKHQLQQIIALRGLADYIAMSFIESDQDELICHLKDPTKVTRIIIEVNEKPR
jgi:hypothetical protein